MLGDDRSKGDIKLQQGIRLFGKIENTTITHRMGEIDWGES